MSKYLRTKDGRIVEKCNLEPGFKQSLLITIIDKKSNKVLSRIICDDLSEFFEMTAIGEYCKYHKINPKDIKWERKILLNDILKQADTIEELCDAYVITSKQGHIYDTYGDYGYELKEVLPQAKKEEPDEDWNLYGCILVNGIIKQVAKLNDEKGELVYQVVRFTLPDMLNPQLTASWEKGLDMVAKKEIQSNEFMVKLENYIKSINKLYKDIKIYNYIIMPNHIHR